MTTGAQDRSQRRIRRATALFLTLALTAATGCSNLGEGQQGGFATAFSELRAQIKLRRAGGQAAPGAGVQVTRAMLAGVNVPVLSARFDRTGLAATMTVIARSGPHLTWKSLDDVTITTRNGIIVQTRGLADDLMSVGTLPLRPGRGERVYQHLAEDNKMRRLPLICEVADRGAERIVILERGHATRHYQETCTAADGQKITNSYWVGGDGTVWASHQWLGPELGHIRLERYLR